MTRKLQNCILNIPYANKNYFTSNKNKFEKSLILAYVTLLHPWIVPLITIYPVEYCLESVVEYSEGRVHKSEPEPRNGNVNTVYFNNQARGNSRISHTEFVYDEREHAMANFYLYLNFLLRICS